MPNPLQPCPFPTGSRERIDVYRQRLELGIPLNQPGDSDQTIPIPFEYGESTRYAPGIRQCKVRCAVPDL